MRPGAELRRNKIPGAAALLLSTDPEITGWAGMGVVELRIVSAPTTRKIGSIYLTGRIRPDKLPA